MCKTETNEQRTTEEGRSSWRRWERKLPQRRRGGITCSHFPRQSVVKLVSQSVRADYTLSVASYLLSVSCAVEGEVAVTLQNMKEHFTWRRPLGFLPLFTLAVKILTQAGESKLHFTLMYQTLCPFELLIFLEGGSCRTQTYPWVFSTHAQH